MLMEVQYIRASALVCRCFGVVIVWSSGVAYMASTTLTAKGTISALFAVNPFVISHTEFHAHCAALLATRRSIFFFPTAWMGCSGDFEIMGIFELSRFSAEMLVLTVAPPQCLRRLCYVCLVKVMVHFTLS